MRDLQLKGLKKRTGGLSNTSKMPGYSFGLPIFACKRGAQLRQIPGSVCHACYAVRGKYGIANVKEAQERRLQLIRQPTWVDDMTALIGASVTIAVPYFRWFDSGDIQSKKMAEDIVEIARRLPTAYFWVATREQAFVKHALSLPGFPDNLVFRVSSSMIGKKPVRGFVNTSTVVAKRDSHNWAEQVAQNSSNYWSCPASISGHKCGTCRACWQKEIKNVAYQES